ncbi:MAG TPA: aspartate-semialdehyde dehydrogenase [bacterium]
MPNNKRLSAAVVGATGIAGQQFILALDNHPWFEMRYLAASERSAGKSYIDALTDEKTKTLRWYCNEPIPENMKKMKVLQAEKLPVDDLDIVFTALESDAAKVLEPMYAQKKPVISTASAFRYEEDVPIFIPGVNMEQADIINVQKKKRGWKGFITPIPNCTTTGLAASLKPLQDTFGIDTVIMTSMQAISGAGRSPGVLALDITDNVIPYIHNEEDKVEKETKKILGQYLEGKIIPAAIKVSATCTRVGVLDGHTETVYVSMKKDADPDKVKKTFKNYGKDFLSMKLPSSPPEFFVVHDDPMRPQPRLDRDLYGGMAVVIGRVRKDPALPNGIKYVVLSHNTKIGAAKGAVNVAEWLYKKGYIS